MITVKRKVHFVRRDHGRKTIANAPRPTDQAEPGRIPRISRLMALAIRFDRLVREGKVTDLSELASLAHVTQPRMTQIMNLNRLAPDIQETLLFLPRVTNGRETIQERMLRPVCAEPDWRQQRKMCQDKYFPLISTVRYHPLAGLPDSSQNGNGRRCPPT